jgi:hypothetical protein
MVLKIYWIEAFLTPQCLQSLTTCQYFYLCEALNFLILAQWVCPDLFSVHQRKRAYKNNEQTVLIYISECRSSISLSFIALSI